MERSAEQPLPVSIAAILQRAFESSTAGLNGYASHTATPIHDQLLLSRTEWASNDWINPFRPLTWKGHQLFMVRATDINPPWNKYKEA